MLSAINANFGMSCDKCLRPMQRFKRIEKAAPSQGVKPFLSHSAKMSSRALQVSFHSGYIDMLSSLLNCDFNISHPR